MLYGWSVGITLMTTRTLCCDACTPFAVKYDSSWVNHNLASPEYAGTEVLLVTVIRRDIFRRTENRSINSRLRPLVKGKWLLWETSIVLLTFECWIYTELFQRWLKKPVMLIMPRENYREAGNMPGWSHRTGHHIVWRTITREWIFIRRNLCSGIDSPL